MVDQDVRLEVLSALLGKQVKFQDECPGKTSGPLMTVDDFLISTILGNQTLIKPEASVLKNDVSRCSLQEEFFINESEFFDPPYDCDFTGRATGEACERGNEPYERPWGWYRMALKVIDKYPDGNTWLGPGGWRSESARGEWPVSYHGTSLEGAQGIIRSHYKAGAGDTYGRGVYSTPKLSEALEYTKTKTFKSQKNGKTYQVIMQNRINPKVREICKYEDYWLIPVPEGTSADKERHIVQGAIRPYGILIRDIPETSCSVL